MREVKFRFAFEVGSNVVFKYMTLDELLDCSFAHENMIESINDDCGIDGIEDQIEFEMIGKDQYTGLKDKNGAEVYNGDILKACGDSFYAVVEFDDKALMFSARLYKNGNEIKLMRLARFMSSREIAVNGKIKIIGNIHENPELLEKNND